MAEDKVISKTRKKIKILHIAEKIEKFGQYGQKLKFTSEDGVQYETTRKGLFDEIKAGVEIDADTEIHKVIYEGGGFVKSVVTELYDKDGKPITPDKTPSYQGGRKSSDASIEAQVAFKGAVELMVHGVILGTDPLFQKAKEWAARRLAPPMATKTEPKPQEKPKEIVAEPEVSSRATRESVLAYVAMNKRWKTDEPALSYIVNKHKISEERLNNEPDAVLAEIKEIEGW